MVYVLWRKKCRVNMAYHQKPTTLWVVFHNLFFRWFANLYQGIPRWWDPSPYYFMCGEVIFFFLLLYSCCYRISIFQWWMSLDGQTFRIMAMYTVCKVLTVWDCCFLYSFECSVTFAPHGDSPSTVTQTAKPKRYAVLRCLCMLISHSEYVFYTIIYVVNMFWVTQLHS